MSIPGVQIPHCAPPVSRNAVWRRQVGGVPGPRGGAGPPRSGPRRRRPGRSGRGSVDGGAVEEDRARAALALAAAFLGAGEREVLAQHVEEASHPGGLDLDRVAVDGESILVIARAPTLPAATRGGG